MANGNGLASVNHVVVLMLENRSFDHMLGFLYPGNVSPQVKRWNLPTLTTRDVDTPAFGDVLRLTTPRTDDVLAGVNEPVASGPGPAAGTVSHLESIRAELISRRYPTGVSASRLRLTPSLAIP